MTIDIENEINASFDFDYESVIKAVVEKSLDYENCPYEAEVNVIITNNDEIKEINKENRNIDNPTDVLSFPMNEFKNPADFSDETYFSFNPESGELLLGDIVLSYDKIVSQAEQYGHSQKREMAFLVAHSMLHLLGYDHMEEEERKIMENKQEEILNLLDIKRDFKE